MSNAPIDFLAILGIPRTATNEEMDAALERASQEIIRLRQIPYRTQEQNRRGQLLEQAYNTFMRRGLEGTFNPRAPPFVPAAARANPPPPAPPGGFNAGQVITDPRYTNMFVRPGHLPQTLNPTAWPFYPQPVHQGQQGQGSPGQGQQGGQQQTNQAQRAQGTNAYGQQQSQQQQPPPPPPQPQQPVPWHPGGGWPLVAPGPRPAPRPAPAPVADTRPRLQCPHCSYDTPHPGHYARHRQIHRVRDGLP